MVSQETSGADAGDVLWAYGRSWTFERDRVWRCRKVDGSAPAEVANYAQLRLADDVRWDVYRGKVPAPTVRVVRTARGTAKHQLVVERKKRLAGFISMIVCGVIWVASPVAVFFFPMPGPPLDDFAQPLWFRVAMTLTLCMLPAVWISMSCRYFREADAALASWPEEDSPLPVT